MQVKLEEKQGESQALLERVLQREAELSEATSKVRPPHNCLVLTQAMLEAAHPLIRLPPFDLPFWSSPP